MTTAAPLYGPLRICGYALGVFPYTVSRSAPHRFRLHWFGAALKAAHLLLFWSAAASVTATLLRMYPTNTIQPNRQALDKKLASTSPVKVFELYVYMTFTTAATAAACQLHMMLPSVVALVGECLLRPRVHRGHAWPPFKAFTIVAFVVYEFGIYYVLSTARFNRQFFVCLFSFLSNIDCIVIEQFFYVTCLTLCARLKRIHEDVQNLVHKAEHPRWRCWESTADGHPACLGIPAFGAADIRHLRFAHLRATETFSRVNHAFQLPLLLNMIDSVCRIVFYTSEIIPIRISLSWLTLTLNPVTSRRLMPEVFTFKFLKKNN
ncbi:uncharacterized protein LOC132930167 isoform X2 [Rhopalosiphum padi]|uniref:uncharacterized protein LOC132930167 isoform X2 n=1 Tax=Rhopalosiphum padi TaxID=40932 RepID=UPI00298EAE01|nr:uncharacterized protein LOC132930167 isoform X2 [Rhopalosiphum padi]